MIEFLALAPIIIIAILFSILPLWLSIHNFGLIQGLKRWLIMLGFFLAVVAFSAWFHWGIKYLANN